MLKSEFKQSRPFWRSRSPNALFFGQLHDKDICHGISGETSPPKTTDLARSAATQKWVGYAISELFLLFEMESTSKGVIDHRIIDLRSVIFGIFTFKKIWTLSKVLGCWSWNTFMATAILDLLWVDFYSSNTMASEQVVLTRMSRSSDLNMSKACLPLATLSLEEPWRFTKNVQSLKFRSELTLAPSCIFDRCCSTNYFCSAPRTARVSVCGAHCAGQKCVFLCAALLKFQS